MECRRRASSGSARRRPRPALCPLWACCVAPDAVAAMLMSARSDGKSMIGFLADMIYFTDGSGNSVHPVVIEGGAARMNVANIGTVNAGVIQSPDNKFKITLTDGKIEWWD